ncbi:acid phosphatase/Vanadium-dependent haloperoxidase [Lindgomyces ingoldianus]|uniref:Acid phosphatase/Vanadium-dependent haloperoxidase n=1 Tax=Lindgomyces ingoldianus TaxID=673940 RepID=A0ACB6RAY3_9PLEO|nr:acid phosphatase/Vanadium-dependent haloperoxidase [Lindgomyces ingoldianus]KAF2476443.1 acid phosphatase/Vanadium-dependent haloperoxidase [Lindgomyces ingoldianus]
MDNYKLPDRLSAFSKKKLPKTVILSYILDYVIILVLIVTFYALDAVEPFHQPFSLQNYTLHYPYAVHERIPVPELVIIAVAAPAGIIAIYTLVIDGIFSHSKSMPLEGGRRRRLTGRYRFKDRLWELNCGILGLGLSVCAAFTITGALKNAIGKPRPDLISRCQVPGNYTEDPLKLSTHDICTQENNAILKDGFRSFPSGHSSTAFAGLYYLSLYLAAKMHVLDSKGEVWKAFIVMIPTLAAALVAGSRIMDARHHPFDVLSGSFLGILVAWGSYRQYFPPVTETWHKGRAFPIRSWGRGPMGPPRPVIQLEEDVQPLRPVRAPTDEEVGSASGFSSQTVVGDGLNEHGGNVFREQISASQRQRQQQNDQYPGGPSSQYSMQRGDNLGSTTSTKASKYQAQMRATNPFANEAASHHDSYDYSSSEDEENYELQQTYTLSAPQSGAAYNPVAGTFTDTGYHPPAGMTPNPSPPPPGNAAGAPAHLPPTGDIVDLNREAAPAVPPHAAGTTS